MVQRALALYKDPVICISEIKYHLFDHTGHKIADDAINGQTISRNHDTCLARCYKGAAQASPLCLTIQFQGHRHFSCGTIRAYHQDGMTTGAMWGKLRYSLLIGWTAYIAYRHAALFCCDT